MYVCRWIMSTCIYYVVAVPLDWNCMLASKATKLAENPSLSITLVKQLVSGCWMRYIDEIIGRWRERMGSILKCFFFSFSLFFFSFFSHFHLVKRFYPSSCMGQEDEKVMLSGVWIEMGTRVLVVCRSMDRVAWLNYRKRIRYWGYNWPAYIFP